MSYSSYDRGIAIKDAAARAKMCGVVYYVRHSGGGSYDRDFPPGYYVSDSPLQTFWKGSHPEDIFVVYPSGRIESYHDVQLRKLRKKTPLAELKENR